MESMNRMLHPTLWRTCRVLANPTRLNVLKAVIRHPGATVSQLQHACHLPQSSTSHHLRLLQSRGLLTARPVSRYLFYSPTTDPLVGHADSVLSLVRAALEREESPVAIVWVLQGFTQARRIAIVRMLHRSPATPEALVRGCGISLPAVYRHIAKLVDRGWIETNNDGIYRLASNLPSLACALIQTACSERHHPSQRILTLPAK
jgi:DNA-binding transcriptional ArsR family regulator